MNQVPSLVLSLEERGNVCFSHMPMAIRRCPTVHCQEPLTQSHQVIAGLHRPLWPEPDSPDSLRSWRVFGTDVESPLASREQAVFGMGHSMGTAALISLRHAGLSCSRA